MRRSMVAMVAMVIGADEIRVPYSVIKKMAHVFRASDFHVKAVIRKTLLGSRW